MFKVKPNFNGSTSYIGDDNKNYLHSDGNITRVCEYFETPADAQRLLDKFYPKPKHVWKHGDVFKSGHPRNPGIMMYIRANKGGSEVSVRGSSKFLAQVIYLEDATYTFSPLEKYLKGAKFLFNIKEKI